MCMALCLDDPCTPHLFHVSTMVSTYTIAY